MPQMAIVKQTYSLINCTCFCFTYIQLYTASTCINKHPVILLFCHLTVTCTDTVVQKYQIEAKSCPTTAIQTNQVRFFYQARGHRTSIMDVKPLGQQ